MHPQHRTMLWINLLGGLAVLGSYAYELLTHPGQGALLWGKVPAWLRPYYTGSMLAAAVGYFLFTTFFLFNTDPNYLRIAHRFHFSLLNWLYALILIPSAFWMPLTFAMLQRPDNDTWVAIRLVLAVVGLASLGLLASLLFLRPQRPAWHYWLAVVGSAAFCVQTAVLDAVVWPVFFPK